LLDLLKKKYPYMSYKFEISRIFNEKKKESHKIKEAFVSIQQMFIPLTSLIKNFWFGRVLIFLFILGAIVNRMIKACHCYRFDNRSEVGLCMFISVLQFVYHWNKPTIKMKCVVVSILSVEQQIVINSLSWSSNVSEIPL